MIGWWKDQPKRDRSKFGARYALVVSIETERTDLDIWTPVAQMVRLTVEVLSEKDIDEVARWLQGDIRPGLTGRANPASALSRGIRTLATRLLGGEKTQYEFTSARFLTP